MQRYAISHVPSSSFRRPIFCALAAARTLSVGVVGGASLIPDFKSSFHLRTTPRARLTLRSAHFTLWVGTALILIGVVVNVLSEVQHVQFVRAVKSGSPAVDRPVTMAVVISFTLATIGLAMTIYLVFVR